MTRKIYTRLPGSIRKRAKLNPHIVNSLPGDIKEYGSEEKYLCPNCQKKVNIVIKKKFFLSGFKILCSECGADIKNK